MRRQQALLKEHFTTQGAAVRTQEFLAKQKSQPRPVPMVNIIASWHPERKERVLFCAHYDTRPAAHEEPNRADWNRPFLSANDGTSGVALLMEMAKQFATLPTTLGIDIAIFDGEEYIFDLGAPYIREGDSYFLGSRHFAEEYRKGLTTNAARYKAAILLDLFAHPNARLAVEGYSLRAAPGLVDEIWRTAARVGAKSFRYERGFRRAEDVLDDHVSLISVGIPAVNIIDFDYEHWHKLSDTPDKCSPAQLAEVGNVLLEWLRTK
jgi:Zn-dependent M28 family amino/carboxypeptidase